MPAYLISDVQVRDAEAFQIYRTRAAASIARYGGRYLARGGAIEPLEGSWKPQAIIVVEFPISSRLAPGIALPNTHLRSRSVTRRLVALLFSSTASAIPAETDPWVPSVRFLRLGRCSSKPFVGEETRTMALQFRYSGWFVSDAPARGVFYEKAFGLTLRYMHPSSVYARIDPWIGGQWFPAHGIRPQLCASIDREGVEERGSGRQPSRSGRCRL